MTESTVLSIYDVVPCEELRARSGAARLVAVERCTSTMDLTHQLAAEGALDGTVVVAEEQGAGRGRTGKSWVSTRGSGVWTSILIRRPLDAPGGVLSLRVGIELAGALDARATAPIQLKWPNDLFLADRKLAGVLTEARWRGDMLEWIVVGVGVNVRDPGAAVPTACLGAAQRTSDVLVDVVRAVLRAAMRRGELSATELATYAERDLSRGRAVSAPFEGTVLGITSRGGVQIRTRDGDAVAVAGSLVFRSPLAE